MGAVHQTLGRDASQHPGQFQYLRHIGLTVKHCIGCIQTECQLGGGDFQTGLPDPFRLIAFDQGVIIGQKIKRPDVFILAGLDGRPDGAGIISQMRRACSGNAGENDRFAHADTRLCFNYRRKKCGYSTVDGNCYGNCFVEIIR